MWKYLKRIIKRSGNTWRGKSFSKGLNALISVIFLRITQLKDIVSYIKKHNNYSRLFQWVRVLSLTGITQLGVQILSLLCGIYIVRMLTPHEYGLYTIANTMLGTMTILADGGIGNGVMSEGGKVWCDRKKLGAVLSTGLFLRRKFAFLSFTVTVPILFYLLLQHDANVFYSLLICACLIPAFLSALSDSLYQVVPRLHQDIKALQKNQFVVSIGRLVLSVVLLTLFPFTSVALIGNGIPRAFGNKRLKKIALNFADSGQLPDQQNERSILKVVKRTLPESIYYCVSGQITIWLISFLGNTEALASFGALGRITASFAIISTIFSTLFIPRFARLTEDRDVIMKKFFINQILLISVSVFVVFSVYVCSDIILAVLGNDYKTLKRELALISINGCLGITGRAANELLASRGIVIPPAIFISLTLTVQILGLFVFPVDTILGVIYYGMLTLSVNYLVRIAYFLYTFRNMPFKQKRG